ncbi:MAG: bifunctional UDP-N-acetylglucosamine diphosphorylase/glucosamine-1-phosphate N-acetyltransferase GlmU [Proteobacteria bacterium]|nr:bifunctional UDP-N-acetylglucosamine diphosphorylase/glucosamine-1-phosphate N-acetyltransferase GlmU [Pseudomonadota bacterium]
MATLTSTAAVVLAAGKGTRMKSKRPKVLHELCGRPLLGYALELAESAEADRVVVVVGNGADQVREAFSGRAEFVLQAEQLGTGHAVLQARPKLADFAGDVLVLYSDTPLLRRETVAAMRRLKADTGADLVMLTAHCPTVPGRVKRDAEGRVAGIIEAQDATPDELAIEERNTGVYLVDAGLLWEGLDRLEPDNQQGELYITDVVGIALDDGKRVEALVLEDPDEGMGINNRSELATAAALLRRRIAEHWMAEGVTLVDPDSVYIDADVRIGRDTVIEPGCVLQGETVLGENVHVKPFCHIESSQLADDVVIGPSAHLRPGSRLGRGVRIGNYVEVKNSVLGDGVKADHLSYIGDADVGPGASFGCGAITVNYDWASKSRTVVGARANVGCNANLVAPVEIGADAAVAAGSTITKNVPEGSLGLGRTRQRNVDGWRERRNARLGGGTAGDEAPSQGRKQAAPRKKKKSAGKKKTAAKAGQKAKKKSAKKKPARARKKARARSGR